MAKRLSARCEDFSICGLGATASALAGPGRAFDLLRLSRAAEATGVACSSLAASSARGFDVVLGADWLSASFALAWRGHSSSRHVFSIVHGPELEWPRPRSPLRPLYRSAARLALGRFDAVFAANGPARLLLDGVRVRHCESIGRACDPVRFQPAPRGRLARELRVSDRRVLLSVGHLVPERRVDKVLFALRALGVAYPDLCYVVAGDGPERARLELLAERLRIAHRVRFIGRVDPATLPEVYNLCDVFVHLCGGDHRALAAGDGAALLEAQASGKAVVVTARAAEAEGIDQRTAVIVPEDDSSALGDALRALLEDPERTHHLGHAARARVLASATWDLVADRLRAAMSHALRDTRSARASDATSRAEPAGAVLAER
jgi:glycosyltransferase involved in cell wall biosynthesis